MESSTDRILDLIDAGLQSSTEAGMGVGDPESCARCTSAPRAVERLLARDARAGAVQRQAERMLADRMAERRRSGFRDITSTS